MIFFVEAKPLTIFILIFGVPFCLALLAVAVVDSPTVVEVLYSISLVTFYMGLLFLFWIFSVGRYLSEAKGTVSGIAYRFFYISVMYLFLILSLILFFPLFGDKIGKIFSGILLSMLVIGVVCIYYVMTYLSKMIVNVEKKDASNSSDYIETFVALIFFPVGIWFIQSRINKIQSRTNQ